MRGAAHLQAVQLLHQVGVDVVRVVKLVKRVLVALQVVVDHLAHLLDLLWVQRLRSAPPARLQRHSSQARLPTKGGGSARLVVQQAHDLLEPRDVRLVPHGALLQVRQPRRRLALLLAVLQALNLRVVGLYLRQPTGRARQAVWQPNGRVRGAAAAAPPPR